MKIVFVVNNKNNRLAKVLPKIDQYCQQTKEYDVQFVSTLRKKHAIELTQHAVKNGCDYLIAVGGDGTLHEVINGVMQSNIPVNEYPAIGLLPHGSANDFARTAHITNDIKSLFELIKSKSIHKIDIGKIKLHNSPHTHYFINIAGIGLGGEVVQQLEKSTSSLGSSFNYFKHIILGFYRYVKKEVKCTGNSWEWRGKLLQMAVANGRYHGNGLCVAPDAKLADGQFQVSIFGELSVWDYLKNLGKLKSGEKMELKEAYYYHANEVQIETNEECGIEADGEYVGLAPATISILPKAVHFLMPLD